MNTIIHMRTFTFTIPQMHTPMHIHCLTYDASEERDKIIRDHLRATNTVSATG